MAGQYYTGTLLASPIVRGSSGDTYATHHSVLGSGGYMEVGTLAERNALPVDGIPDTIYYDGLSSGQRRLGMLVHVLEDDTIYQFHPKVGGSFVTYAQWMGYTAGQKYNYLASNTDTWFSLISTGSGATSMGENISKEFTQVTHGFLLGEIIGFDGTNYVKVNSSTASTVEPLGMVTKVTDINVFTLTYSGYIDTTGILDSSGNTLTGGTVYYLAPSGATTSYDGKLTPYPPSNITDISKPMLVALASGTTGVVLQYRGRSQTEEGVTLAQFYTYTGNTQIALDKTVTGATNIGYFSGMTGVQTVSILTSNTAYNGNYSSLYNNYYRDASGIIRLGTPTYHGPLRRGYYSSALSKSWLYNTYTGSSNQVGWILVDGNIANNVGLFMGAGNSAANAGTPPFTETEFSYTGGTLNDGYYSNSAVSLDVNGSFYTGSTYVMGGPVFRDKTYQELRLRTIVTNTPNFIRITNNDNFIFISGATGPVVTGVSTASNVGTGAGLIYRDKTGTTLNLRTIKGSGNTTISTVGNSIVVYSSGGTGGGTYNLSSPSVIPLGGICAGTALTGKTAFQLFEELLVPELCGSITAPSLGIGLSSCGVGGLYEIGCTISQTITATFNRGCINPQYCSISDKRSGCVNAYCLVGSGMPSGFQPSTSSPFVCNNPVYPVVSGTQTWSTCARYDAGSPALGSKGTQYCAALISGCTSAASASIIGAYPLFATTSTIATLTKQTIQNMSTATNIQINLVTESGGNKQKFEIPCAWLSAPRPLVGVCQWNTVSSQWEYPGGSAGTSLALWTPSAAVETIQTLPIGYCQYTYNSVDRSAVCIRLVF